MSEVLLGETWTTSCETLATFRGSYLPVFLKVSRRLLGRCWGVSECASIVWLFSWGTSGINAFEAGKTKFCFAIAKHLHSLEGLTFTYHGKRSTSS